MKIFLSALAAASSFVWGHPFGYPGGLNAPLTSCDQLLPQGLKEALKKNPPLKQVKILLVDGAGDLTQAINRRDEFILKKFEEGGYFQILQICYPQFASSNKKISQEEYIAKSEEFLSSFEEESLERKEREQMQEKVLEEFYQEKYNEFHEFAKKEGEKATAFVRDQLKKKAYQEIIQAYPETHIADTLRMLVSKGDKLGTEWPDLDLSLEFISPFQLVEEGDLPLQSSYYDIAVVVSQKCNQVPEMNKRLSSLAKFVLIAARNEPCVREDFGGEVSPCHITVSDLGSNCSYITKSMVEQSHPLVKNWIEVKGGWGALGSKKIGNSFITPLTAKEVAIFLALGLPLEPEDLIKSRSLVVPKLIAETPEGVKFCRVDFNDPHKIDPQEFIFPRQKVLEFFCSRVNTVIKKSWFASSLFHEGGNPIEDPYLFFHPKAHEDPQIKPFLKDWALSFYRSFTGRVDLYAEDKEPEVILRWNISNQFFSSYPQMIPVFAAEEVETRMTPSFNTLWNKIYHPLIADPVENDKVKNLGPREKFESIVQYELDKMNDAEKIKEVVQGVDHYLFHAFMTSAKGDENLSQLIPALCAIHASAPLNLELLYERCVAKSLISKEAY